MSTMTLSTEERAQRDALGLHVLTDGEFSMILRWIATGRATTDEVLALREASRDETRDWIDGKIGARPEVGLHALLAAAGSITLGEGDLDVPGDAEDNQDGPDDDEPQF